MCLRTSERNIDFVNPIERSRDSSIQFFLYLFFQNSIVAKQIEKKERKKKSAATITNMANTNCNLQL